MSKRNIKSKNEAPVNQAEIELHADDVVFIARTIKDLNRARPLSEAERIESIVWKFGPIAEYRSALDPSISTRSYLRRMLQLGLLTDVELEEEEATRRARDAVACDILY